jgi:hypothetical protein
MRRQFWFRKGKATGIINIILERTFDIDEELCACFIDWQKKCDRVNWVNLIQILKETVTVRRKK